MMQVAEASMAIKAYHELAKLNATKQADWEIILKEHMTTNEGAML